MHPIILPVQNDETVKVCGYPESGGIKICLREGGYLNIGVFRAAFYKGEHDQKLKGGPVTVQVNINQGAVELFVNINLPNGKVVAKLLTADVCDEIAERIAQVDMLLFTYAWENSRRLPLEQAVADAAEKTGAAGDQPERTPPEPAAADAAAKA